VIELKTPSEMDAIAAAGAIVADVLATVRAQAAPGVRVSDLDAAAGDLIVAAGARPTFLNYLPRFASTPYPAVTCVSVNDAVVHGIPGPQVLADGDLVSIDLAVHLDDWCADSAISFVVGAADPADLALIDTAQRALPAGIDAPLPWAHLGRTGHARRSGGRRPAGRPRRARRRRAEARAPAGPQGG